MFYVLALDEPPVAREYIEEIIENESPRPMISTYSKVVRKKTKIIGKKYYFSNVSIIKQKIHLSISIFMIHYFYNYRLKLN